MTWRDRIVCDPDILVGKPTIKGTRISVELLLDNFASGWSRDQIRESYPHITDADISAALACAADMMCDRRTWEMVRQSKGSG